MSKVTKFIRAHGGGPILDAIEGTQLEQHVVEAAKAEVQVAIPIAGQLVQAKFNDLIASKLGPGGAFAESTFAGFLKEFEDFVLAKL